MLAVTIVEGIPGSIPPNVTVFAVTSSHSSVAGKASVVTALGVDVLPAESIAHAWKEYVCPAARPVETYVVAVVVAMNDPSRKSR
jgi:hypothetical protein